MRPIVGDDAVELSLAPDDGPQKRWSCAWKVKEVSHRWWMDVVMDMMGWVGAGMEVSM